MKLLRLLPCAGLIGTASGFAPAGGATRAPLTLSSTAASDGAGGIANPLGGVADFEEWFSSNSSSGARVGSVRHASFDSTGRGLQFTSTRSSDLEGVAAVPRGLVLSVPYSEGGDGAGGRPWDADLSHRLWEECRKGRRSAYYGYCSLLTRGASLEPGAPSYPSTAPDALRHWTAAQKSLLEQCDKGKRLLEVEAEQQDEWRRKYDSLGTRERGDMTYENFQWAMEAVHSRAFRGDFGALDGGEGGPFRKIASLLLPLSAIAIGIVYTMGYSPYLDQYFVPLAIVAACPVIFTIIADQKGSKEAVMLPLIDSANHLLEADSVIEYDPLVEAYVLSLGRKCLVKELDKSGERAQVCISYGVKKDSELLLNYGFLRGVDVGGSQSDESDVTRNEIRQRLAEAFVSQNS